MIASTSREAYATVKLQQREQDVLKALTKLGEATNKQLAEELGWEINRVTGRTNGLWHKSKIDYAKKKDPETGLTVKHWRVHGEEN